MQTPQIKLDLSSPEFRAALSDAIFGVMSSPEFTKNLQTATSAQAAKTAISIIAANGTTPLVTPATATPSPASNGGVTETGDARVHQLMQADQVDAAWRALTPEQREDFLGSKEAFAAFYRGRNGTLKTPGAKA